MSTSQPKSVVLIITLKSHSKLRSLRVDTLLERKRIQPSIYSSLTLPSDRLRRNLVMKKRRKGALLTSRDSTNSSRRTYPKQLKISVKLMTVRLCSLTPKCFCQSLSFLTRSFKRSVNSLGKATPSLVCLMG